MDFQKLDSPLALACDNPASKAESYEVLVRTTTPLPPEAIRELMRLRAPKPDPNRAIHTMELSVAEVAALSDHPWVVNIRSSRKLRPLA